MIEGEDFLLHSLLGGSENFYGETILGEDAG